MSEPRRPRFQYGLRTLLLLFVVLGSSMAVFSAWGILVFGLAVGVAVYLRESDQEESRALVIVVLLGLLGLIGWLLIPTITVYREASRRYSCLNKLHQLGLALQGYREAEGHFPPAFTVDNKGTRLHSWRTLILPYMEYNYFYNTLDLSQSWNAPRNGTLLTTRLKEFECPSDPYDSSSSTANTSYVAVVGPNAAWTGAEPSSLADFGTPPSRTIMLVETTNSGIARAEPRDFYLGTSSGTDLMSPPILAVHEYGKPDSFLFKYDHASGIHVAMADGSVCFIRTDNLSTDELRQVLQIGGCRDGTIGARAIMTDSSGMRPNWPNIAALAVWLVSVGALLTAAVRSRKVRLTSPSAAEKSDEMPLP